MNETPKGYIKLARKAFALDGGDPLWLEQREFSRWEAWVDVIQLAAWKPWRHLTQHYGPIDLQRGEFVASLRYLADRWTWTVKKVRTWLSTLEKWARLRAQRETQAGTVYLIVNYERYQGLDEDEGTPEGTPKGTAGAQQGHKREAVKAVKAVKSLAPGGASWVAVIGDFWSTEVGRIAYGRIGKDLKELREAHGEQALLSAARAYVAHQKGAGQPTRWAWFVEQAVIWVERANAGLTVIDGEMSPELERRTRPAAVRRVG